MTGAEAYFRHRICTFCDPNQWGRARYVGPAQGALTYCLGEFSQEMYEIEILTRTAARCNTDAITFPIHASMPPLGSGFYEMVYDGI